MNGRIFDELKKYTVVIILILLMIVFSIASPYFLTKENLTKIIIQNTYFLIVALGMVFVMLGGGIDFSVGYQMSLVGVITAMLMVQYNKPPFVAIITGIIIGTILGFINGLIVVKLKLFPLIVTLATSMVYQGISFTLSQSKTFRSYPESFRLLTMGKFLGIPNDVFLTIILIILVSFIFEKTYFGRFVLACGGNEEAARLSGIKTEKIKITLYAICGFFVAIATMVMLSKSNTHNSTFGPGTEFTALTAGLIGGISFKGGEGKIWGLVTGVFVLAVIGNGMQLSGVSTFVQYIIKGLILLAAMTFDEYQKQSKIKIKKLSDVAAESNSSAIN